MSRARLSRALGDDAGALADIDTALEHDPADLEANLAAMRWGSPVLRLDAAHRVIAGVGRDVAGLREAIRIAIGAGSPIVHRLRPEGLGVSGWFAWPGRDAFVLGLEDGAGEWTVSVLPDASLPLAGEGYGIVEIEIPEVWRVFDPKSATVLYRRKPVETFADRRAPTQIDAAKLCVIVPLYDGFAATQACLASLAAQTDLTFSTILVDDASPNPRLSALAHAAAMRPGVTLLRNDVNLGFARSINRALAISGRDDVVLLNADTILPPRAMARLHAAVINEPGVGTATPFSNNSQLTSFPRPFAVNALPGADEIDALGEIAHAVNGRALLDVPSGIGFCLYITRNCLDRTGPLPTHYGRGYYEDTEFCLIARQRGFRNVCATGVYVGHAGSVSFKTEKVSLVSRNLAILEDRFPRQGAEYLAFAQADPLRAARASIEEQFVPAEKCTIIVASEGRVCWQARQRATDIGAQGGAAVMIVFEPGSGGVELRRAGEGAPVSLSFAPDDQGWAPLTAYLRRLKVQEVEIFDAARTPDRLLAALFDLSAPVDLICVDVLPMRGRLAARRSACETPLGAEACDSCAADRGETEAASLGAARQSRLARAVSLARSVRAVDRLGAAAAGRVFGAKARPLEKVAASDRRQSVAGKWADLHILGVLAPVASIETERLLVTLSRRLARRGVGFRMVVLGACFDETAVRASGSALVVPGDDPDDYARLARLYGVGRLALLDRTTLFGPLDRLADEIAVPKAYFDWSFGALEARPGDLVLDPRICDEKATSAVAFWVDSD